MADLFRVLLAATIDPMKDPDALKKIQYPCWISPKLDGIRDHIREGICLSRKNIELPSRQVQQLFSPLEFCDGENIEGNWTDHDVYNRTQSYVMSADKPSDQMYFYVFDYTDPAWKLKPFEDRLEKARQVIVTSQLPNVFMVPHRFVRNEEELLAAEAEFLEMGFEGVCGRKEGSPYKWNRSTLRENWLWKLKRFEDFEVTIVGFEEQMTNLNEAKISEHGYTKRSHSKEGKVPAGTLGNIICLWNGIEIPVGPGVLKHTERKEIWDNREAYIGKIIKARHFPHGMKDRPRHPRFVGFRDPMDM